MWLLSALRISCTAGRSLYCHLAVLTVVKFVSTSSTEDASVNVRRAIKILEGVAWYEVPGKLVVQCPMCVLGLFFNCLF